MEIKNFWPAEIDKVSLYKLTKGQGGIKMSDAVGTVIKPKAWVNFEDNDAKGNIHNILSFMGEDGQVYATNSPTFVREFMDIADIFDGDIPEMVIRSGVSKNGRNFVTCVLV